VCAWGGGAPSIARTNAVGARTSVAALFVAGIAGQVVAASPGALAGVVGKEEGGCHPC
jgi:hypothetical protein